MRTHLGWLRVGFMGVITMAYPLSDEHALEASTLGDQVTAKAVSNGGSSGLEDIAVTPWTPERAEQWWAEHQPRPAAERPVADILLSHEQRQRRIGPRPRPRG